MSCPTSSFCVALDWEGGSVTWNGAKWTLDAAFDPDGAGGLMSLSCPSATFCTAVDGSGDYLTWNGKHWSSPVQIDVTGDGFESVSCANATFCAAVDWNGNALTWNGSSWTKPALSCPDSTTDSAGTCYTTGRYVDPQDGSARLRLLPGRLLLRGRRRQRQRAGRRPAPPGAPGRSTSTRSPAS